MRRILLILTVAAVMVAMLAANAVPALADVTLTIGEAKLLSRSNDDSGRLVYDWDNQVCTWDAACF
jgi:hypothetical protein